jgi:hypothetical protein
MSVTTAVLLMLAGCNPLPDSVVMTGVVQDAPRALGAAVADATVETADPDGAAFASTVTGADGSFAVDVPAGVLFFVTVRDEGRVDTAFSGNAGVYDFDAGEGYPWIADVAWVDAQRSELLAWCATANEAGGVVVGEVVLFVPNADPSSLPYLPDATVQVLDAAGDLHDACYLPDDTSLTDAPVATGQNGRFAVFGAAAGVATVRVAWEGPAGNGALVDYAALVPEAGVVPLFPAYLQTDG